LIAAFDAIWPEKGTRIKLFSPGKTVTLNILTASMANVSTSPSVECRPNRSIFLLNMAEEVVMTWTKEHLELLLSVRLSKNIGS
jgi:hypothetical protein